MTILNMIAADEEISQFNKELKEKTGQSLGFNYDCYTGINFDYTIKKYGTVPKTEQPKPEIIWD